MIGIATSDFLMTSMTLLRIDAPFVRGTRLDADKFSATRTAINRIIRALRSNMAVFDPKLFWLSTLLLILMAIPVRLVGQQVLNPSTLIGNQPYTTLVSDTESINNADGGVNVSVPLLHLPGINGFDLDLKANYQSKVYDLYGYIVYPYQLPSPDWKPQQASLQWQNNYVPLTDFALGQLSIPQLICSNQFYQMYNLGGQIYPDFCATNWAYVDETGSMHPFANREDCYPIPNTAAIVHVADTNDTSFMQLDTTNLSDVKVYLKNGNIVHFSETTTSNTSPGGSTVYQLNAPSLYPSYIEDPNGNKISFTQASNGLTIKDSLGRTITLSSIGNGPPYTITSIQYNASDGTQHSITTTSTKLTGPLPGTQTTLPDITLHATTCEGPLNQSGEQIIPPTNNLDIGSGAEQVQIVLDSAGVARTFNVILDAALEPVQVIHPGGGYTEYAYQTLTGNYNGGTFECPSYDIREVYQKLECKSSSGSCTSPDITTYTPTLGAYSKANTVVSVLEPADAAGRKRKTIYKYSETDGYSWGAAREISRAVYDNQSTLLKTIQTSYTNGQNPPSSLRRA